MACYVATYGKSGCLALFEGDGDALPRGRSVLLATERGTELGRILCPATDEHRELLCGVPIGRVLRLVTEDDRIAQRQLESFAFGVVDFLNSEAQRLGLPISVLDAEILFDRTRAIAYFLGEADAVNGMPLRDPDGRSLLWESLSVPPEGDVLQAGCGKPDCGKGCGCGDGGCDSCGKSLDVRAYMEVLAGATPIGRTSLPTLPD